MCRAGWSGLARVPMPPACPRAWCAYATASRAPSSPAISTSASYTASSESSSLPSRSRSVRRWTRCRWSLRTPRYSTTHRALAVRSLRPHIVTVCRCSRGQLLCPFSLSSLDAPGILRRGSRQKTWSLIGRNQRKHRAQINQCNEQGAALTVLCALLKRWCGIFKISRKSRTRCMYGRLSDRPERPTEATDSSPSQTTLNGGYIHISTPSQPPSLSTRLAERLPRRPRLTAARSLARPDRKGVARRGDGRGRGPKRGRRARTKGRCRRAATSRAKSWRRRRCAGRGATEPESGRRRGRSAVGKCRSPESSRRRAARARA